MFWSQIAIPGKPRVLVVDGCGNAEGWEAEFCDRLFDVLRRRGIRLASEAPLRPSRPQDLDEALRDQEAFNCVFLFCHGDGVQVPEELKLNSFWNWLSTREGMTPKLLTVCTSESYDSETSQRILAPGDSFAKLAIVPQSPLSARAAGLFYIKFFFELDLHANDSIQGKMVWFSHAKAKELLKRRHLPGQLGVRC